MNQSFFHNLYQRYFFIVFSMKLAWIYFPNKLKDGESVGINGFHFITSYFEVSVWKDIYGYLKYIYLRSNKECFFMSIFLHLFQHFCDFDSMNMWFFMSWCSKINSSLHQALRYIFFLMYSKIPNSLQDKDIGKGCFLKRSD